MHRLLKRGASACCVATLLAAPAVLAGFTTESAHCYKNADGSGRCQGSLLGFRNHAGANTQALFSRSSNAAPYFYAALTTGATTEYFSCTADAMTGAHWSKAMNHEGFFSIYWSAQGDCYSLFLINGSQYSNF
ncbi:hypothetical protein SAMN05443572_10363 [Myxococcus fulvus]|uniref:Lipoprotein n=1 Tax=Myxococcus fulvus TaxID=33 RepID=A0A511TDZ7_MYXFU|nr:hypothetical protein [Myxococcus fulvus]GEN12381.1 hypothetical protein MFU01_74180 [Myxococcus fulvus]SET75154.1 hypothetical protein SAMN05443572_10363 [Myxococcus fulvus]